MDESHLTGAAYVASHPDPVSFLQLVRHGNDYNFTVGSVTAKLIFAHHSHTHPVPGLVLADHHTHGQRDGRHLTKSIPIWEDAATLNLFHCHEDAAAGERKRKTTCYKEKKTEKGKESFKEDH